MYIKMRAILIRMMIITALILPALSIQIMPASAACSISGIIYRDYNQSGFQEMNEPPVRGIIVTAYDASGAVAATDTSNGNGVYNLNLAGAADGEVRVEFEIPQTFLYSGPFGAQNATTVTFVDCSNGAASTLDFGVGNSGDFCDPNPFLLTTCFALGPYNTAPGNGEAAAVSFDYNSGGVFGSGNYDGPHDNLAMIPDVGSVWGLAYHRSSDTYFLTPYMKRHTSFGPGGTGALYAIRNASDPANATVSEFLNFDTYFGANSAGADPRTGNTLDYYLTDPDAYDRVGKIAWGDIEMSSDDSILYAVNLFDRNLYIVPVGARQNGGPTPPQTITRTPIPNPCAANIDWRPFGTAYHDGFLYISGTCTAQSSQNRADLSGHVYRYDPAGGGFASVLTFPMDYSRRCVNDFPSDGEPCTGRATVGGTPFNPQGDGEWLPWYDTFPFDGGGGQRDVAYPQPMFTDVEFDGADMILAFRDRFPDQHGDNDARPPDFDPNNVILFNSRGGGDLLRACWNGNGWDLENNGTCGSITTNGADSGQGPGVGGGTINGNGEYYLGETYPFYEPANPPGYNSHSETSLGGLAQIPGFPDTVLTVFDPVPIDNFDALFDGGVRWLRNRDGNIAPATDVGNLSRAYRVFNGNTNPPGPNNPLFGKANGLGDIEAACSLPPLEIGNRVWEDLDRNGRQDPGEQVFGNVVLSLYLGGRNSTNLIAQTTTDGSGEYYFNADTIDAYRFANGLPMDVVDVTFFDIDNDGIYDPREPRGIMPNTTYTIRIDDASNYDPTTGPSATTFLAEYTATELNADAVLRDSDAEVTDPLALVSVANAPFVVLTTGDFAQNNHTYDFGFALPVPETPTPTPTNTATPPATSTDDGGDGGDGGNGATPAPDVAILPRTGESPVSPWRSLILLAGLGFGLTALVLVSMRMRPRN